MARVRPRRSKPGGLTTSEAWPRAGLRVVSTIPGQDERNSDHLIEEGGRRSVATTPGPRPKIDGLHRPTRVTARRPSGQRGSGWALGRWAASTSSPRLSELGGGAPIRPQPRGPAGARRGPRRSGAGSTGGSPAHATVRGDDRRRPLPSSRNRRVACPPHPCERRTPCTAIASASRGGGARLRESTGVSSSRRKPGGRSPLA